MVQLQHLAYNLKRPFQNLQNNMNRNAKKGRFQHFERKSVEKKVYMFLEKVLTLRDS